MPPEYAMGGVFSRKSDVYSFGVLLLEIVSGRRNNSFSYAANPMNLVGHVCYHFLIQLSFLSFIILLFCVSNMLCKHDYFRLGTFGKKAKL